jgi:hypothetical protein
MQEAMRLAHVADRIDAVQPRECAYRRARLSAWREDVVDADHLLCDLEAHPGMIARDPLRAPFVG